MSSQFLPNSYQTPNAYVDEFFHLLTGEEWKILSYFTRRIIGFQLRQDRISLTQLVEGLVDDDGETRYDWGTGLSRTAAAKALGDLIEFGFILIVNEDKRGSRQRRLYRLQLNSDLINREGLQKRAEEWYEKNVKRTRKASAKRSKNEASDKVSQSVPRTTKTPHAVRPTDHENTSCSPSHDPHAVRPTDHENTSCSPSDEPQTGTMQSVRRSPCGPSDDHHAVRATDRHEIQENHENQNQNNNNTDVVVVAKKFETFLLEQGMSEKWSRYFGRLIPYEIGKADFEARRADHMPISHIVNNWREQLPTTSEEIYVRRKDRSNRSDATHQPQRSEPMDRRPTARSGSDRAIRPSGNPPAFVPLDEERKAALRSAPRLSVDLSVLSGRGEGDGSS